MFSSAYSQHCTTRLLSETFLFCAMVSNFRTSSVGSLNVLLICSVFLTLNISNTPYEYILHYLGIILYTLYLHCEKQCKLHFFINKLPL